VSRWPSTKAKKVFAAIARKGWSVRTPKGSSRKQMIHPEHGQATWAFHDSDEIGPKMMARLAKEFHFTREDI
jgi:predicted RNA binding protein YcfA (HicA-like mRNA interferase family)